MALAKLEYVDRVVAIERACRGNPSNVRLGMRDPVHGDQGDRRRATSTSTTTWTRTCWSTGSDLLEIFPRRPPRARAIAARGLQSRTANAQSAARFIQQHQNIIADRIKRWIGDSDKREISQLLRQMQALCTAEHMVVPDSRRTEKLIELTVVATWHVVDGIHRLS